MTRLQNPTKPAGRPRHHLHRRRRTSMAPAAFRGTLFRLCPRLEIMEDRTLLSTFLVTTTADSSPGSLRQAILDSNAATGGTNTIDFNIPDQGVQTIAPLSSLPAITNPVLIDGFSQPGYAGTPLIELTGSQAGSGDSLTITGPDVTARGLDINNFGQGAGIHITGTGATGDWIYGNFLGTDPTGTQAAANNEGVEIDGGASHNLIGTNGDGVNDTAERNVISGNLFAGVWINGQGTDGNAVAGDFIGTSVTGDVALDNDNYGTSTAYYAPYTSTGGGVVIQGGASANRIGTDGGSVDDAGQRNIIAGSGNDGIDVVGSGTEDNVIAGNFIGTDVTGTASLGIANIGVFLADGASSNWIGVNPNGGGMVGDEGNVISGNGLSFYEGDGVLIGGSDGNVVAGNKIGTDVTGTVALGNGSTGIAVFSAASNTIGGTTSGAGNVISSNGAAPNGGAVYGYGVWISGQGANDNVIAGNAIGTDITGTAALANAQAGVQVDQGAANTTIGGLTSPAGVFHGFAFAPGSASTDLTLRSDLSGPPGPVTAGGTTAVYRIDWEEGGLLLAIIHAEGFTARLMMLDSQGRVLVQSDGLSPSDPDCVVDEHLARGSYSLVVESTGGAGTYTLTTSMALSSAPFQPIPTGTPGLSSLPFGVVAGDFTGDGHLDLAIADHNSNDVSVLLSNGDGTFQPAVTYSVGSNPEWIVAGDFNGDGHLDLAVANSVYGRPDTVSVLLGNGDGTFQPPVTYADGLGSRLFGIVAGDFTGDGKLDLAVAGYGVNSVSGNEVGEVALLLNNGDGTFQPPVTYAVGLPRSSGPSSFPAGPALVAGDFTGDGHLDLAVAGSGYNSVTGNVSEVSMLLGNGDGTFQPPVTYAVGSTQEGSFPDALVAGDFTGDGHLDLATANYGFGNLGTVSVLLGNGDGTFQPQVTYAVGLAPEWIVARDFTGDGKLDLAVASGTVNTVSLLLGNGDGTFQPAKTIAAGNYPEGLVAGDFNGDGRTDLAMLTTNGNSGFDITVGEVSVLLDNGDGTFQSQAANAVNGEPGSIATGDFTGDGRTDLVVTNGSGNSVSVLLGNGDGTFQPQATYAVGGAASSVVTGDFNGDGRLDLAFSSYDPSTGAHEVEVMLGNGDGTFQPAKTIATGISGVLVAGDFTGDGRLDLAVASYAPSTGFGDVEVLLGNGDGTFQSVAQYALGVFPEAIAAGDFIGDGHLDLAVAGYGVDSVTGNQVGEVSLLLGNGDGTFQPGATYMVGPPLATAIVAGDFTGDGKLDLAVAGPDGYNPTTGASPGEVDVLLGNGDGTFQPGATYANAVENQPEGIVAGDFTGDGKLDLAVTDWGLGAFYYGAVRVLLGNGDGTFQAPVAYAVGATQGGAYPSALVAGDFTGDGKLDLATANHGDNTASVLLGNGDGTFVDPNQVAAAPHATPLVADVNRDGTDDVLVVDGAGNILYRQGIPGQPGSFEPPVTVNPGFPARDIAWLPKTDQGPVLASVDAQDNALSFYAYREGQFVRLSGSLPTGRLPAQILAAVLNGDGLDDLVVRNAGDGSLSVYLATFASEGPMSPLEPPSFVPAETLPVGLGVSDVRAVDTRGDGVLDLVVTNKVSGQVSVLLNLVDGFFAPLVPYRAGTGLSVVVPGSTPEVTSLEATAGVAAGPFTTGSPTDLLTINPGSNTMDLLAGLGRGRFANPVTIETPSPAAVVRVADFTGKGIPDLAVITTVGLSIYLGDGKGGFLPPTTYAVPPEADGLTVADLLDNGQLDLLVGDAYGDVLVLLSQGNGTFQPYHEANQTIELAVADLTSNGSKDIIYADQGLDRVVVDYGAGSSSVLADQSSGLLAPGAVALADLNGDGIPDLVVANSGSNNVLIYPGLGNGQFGPALNDGHGYFVGTNPVGITVADLTGQKWPDGRPRLDLVVADKGSNQVSILLNNSQGGDISFAPGTRLNAGGSGPVSTVVGHFTGGPYPDLLVTNSGSNDVALLPGVGQGFFNDTNPRTFAVGANPVTSFVGDFNGQPDLVTVNAGSNDLTLISGFEGAAPSTSTIASGGVDPDTAFAFSAGSGFEDLVVGNAGDGVLSLFEGGPDGLGLMSAATEPNLPDPTALAFAALTGGQVQFYAATAGREAAELVALSLGIQTEANAPLSAGAPPLNAEAQLVALQETSLPLVATVLTLTLTSAGAEPNLGLAETEVASVAAFLPGAGISVGQGAAAQSLGSGGTGADTPAQPEDAGANAAGTAPAGISAWERLVIGLDEALERFQRENPGGLSGAGAAGPAGDRSESSPAPTGAAPGGPSSLRSAPGPLPSGGTEDGHVESSPAVKAQAIDAAVESLWGDDQPDWAVRSQAGTANRTSSTRSQMSESFPTRSQGASPSWTGRPRPRVAPVPQTGLDEPGLTSASLVIAVMAVDWAQHRRSHHTPRPGWSGRVGNPVRRREVVE